MVSPDLVWCPRIWCPRICTKLELADLENSDVGLSEIEVLFDEVAEVNPIYAAAMERLYKAGIRSIE